MVSGSREEGEGSLRGWRGGGHLRGWRGGRAVLGDEEEGGISGNGEDGGNFRGWRGHEGTRDITKGEWTKPGREEEGRAFSDFSIAPLSPAAHTQLPHVQGAGSREHRRGTSICCLVTLLRARVRPPSALLHMADSPANDGHSHNYNNYRGNNKIRMD